MKCSGCGKKSFVKRTAYLGIVSYRCSKCGKGATRFDMGSPTILRVMNKVQKEQPLNKTEAKIMDAINTITECLHKEKEKGVPISEISELTDPEVIRLAYQTTRRKNPFVE